MKKLLAILISVLMLQSGILVYSAELEYEYIDFGNVKSFEELVGGYAFYLTDGSTVFVDEWGNVTDDKLSVIGSDVFYNKTNENFEVYDNSGKIIDSFSSAEYIVFDTAESYVGIIHRAEYNGERRLRIYSKDSRELVLDAPLGEYIADKNSEVFRMNKKGFFVCEDVYGKASIADPYGRRVADGMEFEKLNIYENGFFGLNGNIWYALDDEGKVLKTLEGFGSFEVNKYCNEEYTALSKGKTTKVFDSDYNPLFELEGYYIRDIPCADAVIVADEDTYEWNRRGLVNWKGEVIIPTDTYIRYIGEGVFFADNLDDTGNRKAYLVKADGTILAENVSHTTEIGDNGYIGVAEYDEEQNDYDSYFIDSQGNRVLTVPEGYYLASDGAFSEGKAAVVSDIIYTWYGRAAFIDEQGIIVLKQSDEDNAPTWVSAGKFKNGIFRAYTHLGKAGPRGSLLVRYTGGASPSDWAKADVESAIKQGYVPQSLQALYGHNISRAEFCDLAVAVLESRGKADADIQNPSDVFCDTDSGAVMLLYSKGIINGKDTEKASGKVIFDPNSDITREEAAKILNNLMDVLYDPWTGLEEEPWNDTAEFAEYADSAQISGWAKDFVEKISKRTIMNGIGNGRFDPQGGYTREQSIVTMKRICDYEYDMPWSISFEDGNTEKYMHPEGHDPTFADGISGFSADAVKNQEGGFDISGEGVAHIFGLELQNSPRYGGLQFGFSLTASHMSNDPRLYDFCMEISTIKYDGVRLADNADIANEHVKIQINGKNMEIKDVRQRKGSGHMDFYFVLDGQLEKEDINSVSIICNQ